MAFSAKYDQIARFLLKSVIGEQAVFVGRVDCESEVSYFPVPCTCISGDLKSVIVYIVCLIKLDFQSYMPCLFFSPCSNICLVMCATFHEAGSMRII